MLKFCKHCRDQSLTDSFESLLQRLHVHNVFNPSFLRDDNLTVFSFRAIPNDNDWLMSYIAVGDGTRFEVRNISLELFETCGGKRLIDPKLFRLGNDIYATFNSGWIPGGNDIYVMKVHPRLEAPKRVRFPGRREQERNWAFFSENGEVYALYKLFPLQLLRLAKERSDCWEMEEAYRGTTAGPELSIGTQLSGREGRYSLVAHRKFLIGRKKLYLGKLCHFDSQTKTVSLRKYWLAHSVKSLLGSHIKHNTNLFSCTYFSGLEESESELRLSYGVNDVDWGFSIFTKESL